jgi:hypothetical protein
VQLSGGDAELRGFVALALVDDGYVVVPDAPSATHTLTIADDADGTLLTVSGAGESSSRLPHGPAGLVELEVARRASALVSAVPPRVAQASDTTPIAFAVAVRTAGTDAIGERVAAALLERGVSLASRAREQLCVQLDAAEVIIAWGTRCEGRPVALARADLVPSAVVGEALRLRDAAPLEVTLGGATEVPDIVSPRVAPAPPSASTLPPAAPAGSAPEAAPPAAASAVSTSAPAAPALLAPVAPAHPAGDRRPILASLRLGVMTRPLAPDAIGGLALAWLAWRGIGPTLSLTASGSQPHALLTIAELAPQLGVAAHLDVPTALARFSVRGALLGGALLHGWFAQGENTLTLRPDLLGTLAGGATWWFAEWPRARVGLDLDFAGGGELRRTRIHTVGGAEVWRRDPFLLTFSAGLTVDIGTATPDVETSQPLTRGDLDGARLGGEGEGAAGPGPL